MNGKNKQWLLVIGVPYAFLLSPKDHPTDREALKKSLLLAYPFGLKENHPYKVWLDEINRQLGQKGTHKTKEIPIASRPTRFVLLLWRKIFMLTAGKIIFISTVVDVGFAFGWYQIGNSGSELDFLKQLALSSPSAAALVVFIWLFFRSWAERTKQEEIKDHQRQTLEHERWNTMNTQLGKQSEQFAITVQTFVDTVKEHGRILDRNTEVIHKNHEKIIEKLIELKK